MKKIFTLLAVTIAITLLSACTTTKGTKGTKGTIGNTVKNTEIKDMEAYCASFVESCPVNEKRCKSCGISVAASYTSCHSREFCNNIPME